MTLDELALRPVLCKYCGDPGMLAYDPSDHEHLFFLNNKRNGMENRMLLRQHPEYPYSYAICFRLMDSGNIDFELSSIEILDTNELIFKKITKFSL